MEWPNLVPKSSLLSFDSRVTWTSMREPRLQLNARQGTTIISHRLSNSHLSERQEPKRDIKYIKVLNEPHTKAAAPPVSSRRICRFMHTTGLLPLTPEPTENYFRTDIYQALHLSETGPRLGFWKPVSMAGFLALPQTSPNHNLCFNKIPRWSFKNTRTHWFSIWICRLESPRELRKQNITKRTGRSLRPVESLGVGPRILSVQVILTRSQGPEPLGLDCSSASPSPPSCQFLMRQVLLLPHFTDV